ncbi:MAG: MFS transporter [Actinomycetia bacterium]|nr:MFS transporter [Actinomycetes bacterium]
MRREIVATIQESRPYGTLSLTAAERPAFWATFLGWALDGMDYMIYTLVLPALLVTFKLTTVQGGVLGSTTLLVSALGGIIAGTVSDRIGRVRTLAAAVVVYSVFTALSGLATSYSTLLVFRALEGLGFGGEWAVGAVLVAETVRNSERGRVLGYMQSAWAIGWGIAEIVALIVLPIAGAMGWRILFWIGILPAFLAFYILRRVPEPAVWVKKADTARQGLSFWKIFRPGLLRRTVFAALLAAGADSGYYAIFTWLPTYLKADRHLSVVGSGSYLLLVILGSFVGYVVSGYIADWLGRKATFVIYAVLSAVVILAYTHFNISNGAMLGLSFPLGFFASGIFSGFGSFLAELFPTEVRGAGQGFTYNVGRGVSALAPLIVGALATTYGLAGGISIFAPLVYLVCLVSLLFLPETKRLGLAE